MNQRKSVPIRFEFPEGRDRIRFANHFVFSQVEMDILLDIGVVDPKEIMVINQKIQAGTVEPGDELEAVIFQRIGMSISSFVKLKQQIDQIFNNLERQGILVKRPGQETLQ